MKAPLFLCPSILGLSVLLLAACGDRQAAPPDPTASAVPAAAAPNAMKIDELRPGAGAAISAGQKAVVQYTGWLYEASAPDTKGKEFDSSSQGGQPFSFVVGAGQVIKGWDEGVLGMSVGERRRLTIPADLGYGDVGAGGVIPPGATLVFDIELIAIQ